MERKNIQDTLYSYLMLYKKGLSVQDIIENHEVLSELCKNLQKSNRNCCDINLRFVFNGEIYNDAELRRELTNKGHYFRSMTDTEVILKMYVEYGFERMICRLNGMFAIVIMHLRSNILYMARDRFGIKPLYYSDVDNKIFFASEIKSIIQFKDLKKELDLDAYNARIIFSRPSDQVLVKNVNSWTLAGH